MFTTSVIVMNEGDSHSASQVYRSSDLLSFLTTTIKSPYTCMGIGYGMIDRWSAPTFESKAALCVRLVSGTSEGAGNAKHSPHACTIDHSDKVQLCFSSCFPSWYSENCPTSCKTS